jgi:hypothetical protein
LTTDLTGLTSDNPARVDGGTSGDAAADASPAEAGSDTPAADGRRLCDQPHTFCDDFDALDAQPLVRWDSVDTGGAR